jgi:hypothetical protein
MEEISMRLRFDENTLTKNPKNPISTDVEPTAPPSVANYLDLCHLPAGALAWLFTRTTAQVNSAAMIGKTAYEAGSPVTDSGLLRVDHNVLVLMFQNGAKLAVYPDGAIGHEGQVLECTPESVMSVIGGPQAGMDMGMDSQMDPSIGNPLIGPMADTGIDTTGMDNVAGSPDMENASLGDIGDPVEVAEPMIDGDFYGTPVDGIDPTEEILKQVGATDGPDDLPFALVDDTSNPTLPRRERRKR